MSTVLDEVTLEGAPELASLLSASLRTEPETPIVLALDIGTSGVRAQLFDGRGREIAGSLTTLSSDLYPTMRGGDDTDADALFELLARAVDQAVERASALVGHIDYVAVSCFWHSLLGVDDAGRPVTPILGWADTRAAEYATHLRTQFDEPTIHRRTGCRFHPSYWPAKLLWLRGERSEFFANSARWLSFSDYVALRLFGETITSISMASGTGLLDQHNCKWDSELAAVLVTAGEQLPLIAPPGETLQTLRPNYADRWPLLEGAAWFPAVGDGAANNIGAVCPTQQTAALMIGTSGALRVTFAGPPPKNLPSELFCYRAGEDRVVIGGALSDGGSAIDWVKSNYALDYPDEEIEDQLRLMEPDQHGLTVLPFWAGERSPGWSSAGAEIVGLTSNTRPIEVLQAVKEAICFRFALVARALEKIAPDFSIVATGNALLSSPAWMQMMADVLGRRITVSPVREASCRGAALLALEAVGKIERLETIEFGAGEDFEPDPDRTEVYGRAIERQVQLYHQLVDLKPETRNMRS